MCTPQLGCSHNVSEQVFLIFTLGRNFRFSKELLQRMVTGLEDV